MSDVVWKAFKLNSLFERSTKLALGINQKDLHISKEKTEEYPVALISASRNGSGSVGYLSLPTVAAEKISFNKITFDDQWGYTYFQQDKFVITGGHNAILEIIDNKLKTLLDENIICYSFISLILNTITIKTGIYGYSYKINNKFDREIILLPCLEVKTTDDYIWEEDNRYYTLAVDYINKLMDEAKELREQKTIRLYEAERSKYEAERSKYEAEYKKIKTLVVWKSFKLGELFDFNSSNQLSLNKKSLDFNNTKDEKYTIALITQSEKNNGISGYLEEKGEIKEKKMNNFMTYSMHFGLCFYHNYDFALMDTHGSVFRLIAKNENLLKLLQSYPVLNHFFSSNITHICNNGIYNYSWLPNSTRVYREILLLPCLEVKATDDYIWKEDNRYYTLAVDYISYIYLTGRIMHYQKLIDKYVYQY